jgi:hypothetical protein
VRKNINTYLELHLFIFLIKIDIKWIHNIIIGLNIIATFGANVGAAKKGIKDKVGVFKDKPKTYLQTLPLVLSTIALVVLIVSLFQIGTLEYTEYQSIRVIDWLSLVFSWYRFGQ